VTLCCTTCRLRLATERRAKTPKLLHSVEYG